MSRKILLVCLAAGLALSACAPGAQAQPPAAIQPSSPTPLPATQIPFESPEPTATRTAAPTPASVAVKPGAFENGLLVTEWTDQSQEDRLYLLDPASGQALPGYPPIALGTQYVDVLSPDRRTLAIVKPGSLLLFDLPTWQEQIFQLPLVANVSAMAFDSQGRQLAVVYGDRESQALIFDLDQQAVTAQGALDFLCSRLKFTSDGRALMLYGTAIQDRFTAIEATAGSPRVALLDAGDLSLRWSAELQGVRDGIYPATIGGEVDLSQPDSAVFLYPGLAFAPDRDALYVVHPDQDQLTRVDFAAQEVATVEIRASLSWFERLLSMTAGVAHAKVAQGTSRRAVSSPDGQFLYVVGVRNTVTKDQNGEWQFNSSPLGLYVIQTAGGARLARFDTQADDVAISPDGRFLYLSKWEEKPWTEVYDISAGEVITRLDGILKPVLRMNGEPLLASSDWNGKTYRDAVVDPHTLAVLSQWTGPGYLAFLSTP